MLVVEHDDFVQYLQTEDAKRAEHWQLESLASFRRSLPGPLEMVTYARLRASLDEDAAAQRPQAQNDRIAG